MKNKISTKEIFKIIDLRGYLKYCIKYNENLIRLRGTLYGLFLADIISLETYDRYENLFDKIENKKIISLRK